MTYVATKRFDGREDTPQVCMARVQGVGGTNITQASITSITCKVFDLSGATPDTAETTPTVTVATSVFDTLQTDDMWDEDTVGYNFRFTVPAASFSTGDHYYLIEFTFTPTSGDAYTSTFEVYAAPLRSS